MRYIVRGIQLTSHGLDVLGRVAVLVMMLFVLIAIATRWLRIPSVAIFDLIVLMGVIAFMSPWAYTEVLGRHLRVDMLTSHLPRRVQLILDSFMGLISLATSGIVIWYAFSAATMYSRTNQVMSVVFPLPVSIITYLVAGMLALFALVLLVELVEAINRSMRK